MSKLRLCLRTIVISVLLVASTTAIASLAAALTHPSPTRQADNCDANQVLIDLKPKIPYEQAQLSYSTNGPEKALAVWFVDTNIDPGTKASGMQNSLSTAVADSIRLAHLIKMASPCASAIFSNVNAMVVDRNYSDWAHLFIPLNVVPTSDPAGDEELKPVLSAIQASWVRKSPAKALSVAPKDSCTWPQALEKIRSHFNPDDPNISFTISRHETGTYVWAQWHIPDNPASQGNTQSTETPKPRSPSVAVSQDVARQGLHVAMVLNLAMELKCVHPQVTSIIASATDDAGSIIHLGSWPRQAFIKGDLKQYKTELDAW